jgi:hypothetical protein
MTRVLFQTMLILAVTIGSVSVAAAQRPWTTIGSAGTVDDADVAEVDTAAATVRISATAPVPASVVVRYNVVAVEGLFGRDAIVMSARYRDNGSGARVVTALKRLDFTTGVITTMLTFDSNSRPPAGDFQIGVVHNCMAPVAFDFLGNVYFVEVTLTKSSADGAPALQAIQLSSEFC